MFAGGRCHIRCWRCGAALWQIYAFVAITDPVVHRILINGRDIPIYINTLLDSRKRIDVQHAVLNNIAFHYKLIVDLFFCSSKRTWKKNTEENSLLSDINETREKKTGYCDILLLLLGGMPLRLIITIFGWNLKFIWKYGSAHDRRAHKMKIYLHCRLHRQTEQAVSQ